MLFLILSVRSVLKGAADWHIGYLLSPTSFLPRRLALIGLTLGYIVIIQWLGFTLTTFAFLCAAMLLLGRGRAKRLILGFGLAFSLGGYLLFVVAFETRFPEGPFEQLMKALF